MPTFIDLTGQDINNWHIIKRDIEYKGKSVKWICQCTLCGQIKSVRSSDIRSGKSKNCGCERNRKTIERNKECAKDRSGDRYGYLECLYPTEKRNSSGHVIWMCKCHKCGCLKEEDPCELQKEKTISCGCAKESIGEYKIKTILLENNINFIQQKTFENCKYLDTNRYPHFDFFVDNKYIIEYDGEQHFFTKGFITEEKLKRTQEQDIFKNNWCKENNIPLIRIPYTRLNKICLNDLLLDTSSFIIQKGEKIE